MTSTLAPFAARFLGRRAPAAAAAAALLLGLAPAAAQSGRNQHDHGAGSSCSPLRSPPPPAAGDQQLAQEWLREARRFRTEHFEVVTDLPGNRAERLAAGADRMHVAYRSALGRFRERPGGRQELWLFHRADDHRRVVAREFDVDVRDIAGVSLVDGSRIVLVGCAELATVDPAPAAAAGGRGGGAASSGAGASPAAVPSAEVDAVLARVLRHEGFHQAQVVLFPEMPAWAAEGVAELFASAVPIPGSDELLLGEIPAERLTRLRQASRARTLEPLEAFLRAEGDEDHDDDEDPEHERWNATGAAYASARHDQAWALVHFLRWGESGAHAGRFASFLKALNRGASGSAAWAQSFGGVSPASLEPGLFRFIDRATASDLRGALDRLAFLADGIVAVQAADGAMPPADFAALRTRLEAMAFVYEPGGDAARAIRASDPGAFAVPGGGEARFDLVDCGQGIPPCIALVGPMPREIGVRWERRGRGRVDWTYVWR